MLVEGHVGAYMMLLRLSCLNLEDTAGPVSCARMIIMGGTYPWKCSWVS